MFAACKMLNDSKVRGYVFLTVSVLLFVISQYSLCDYYFINKQQGYFNFIYFIIMAMFFAVAYVKKSNYFILAALIFLAVAWYQSYSGDKTKSLILPFIFYSLFSLFFFLGYIAGKKNDTGAIYVSDFKKECTVYCLAGLFAVIAALYHPIISDFFLEQTHATTNINYLHYIKPDTVVKFFSSNSRVFYLHFFYIIIILAYIKIYSLLKRKNEFLIIATIFLAAVAGKIIALYVYDGFKIIVTLMNNPNVMDYYVYTHKLPGFMDFLADYKTYQTGGHGVAIHLRSHPPLMAFLYWALCRVSDCAPLSVAMLVMILTAVSSVLIYFLIREYFGNKDIAFTGGILYAVSANNILQSRAYSDSIQVPFFILVLLVLLIASRKRSLLKYGAAGIIFGISTYLNFSSWIQLVLVFPLFFNEENFSLNSWLRAALNFIVFAAVVALFHVLFSAFTGFNYFESYKLGTSTMNDTVGYPYTTWWWASVFHWLKYIGSGIFALWILLYIFVFKNKRNLDTFSLMAAVSFVIFSLSSVVMGQMAWKFMYILALILPCAAQMAGRFEGRNWIMNTRMLVIIVFITYFEVFVYNALLVDPQ